MTKNYRVNFTVGVSVELLVKIDQDATDGRESRSAVIERILKKHYDKEKK